MLYEVITVVNGRPVNGLAALPYSQLIRYRERLAVADNHPLNTVVRHPGDYPGVHAHAGQADLVTWTFLVLVGERRQLLLVSAPAKLGSGCAFLSEAFHAPCIYELIP